MNIVCASSNRLGNRNSNQDRCLVLQRPGAVLLAVADGMGGHDRGDLAAQTAVDSLRRSFFSCPGHIDEPSRFLGHALNHAHLAVVDAGHAQQPVLEPRTTAVVCLVQDHQACWAHLGDSRLYLMRDGAIVSRTRDHTPVEEMVQNGLLEDAAMRTHPMRNSVSRCLGGTPTLPKISFGQARLEAGDTLLLCSDGLWSALTEQRLCDLPEDGQQLQQRINQLTDEADVATYPHSDNITLVGLRWFESPAAEVAAKTAPAASTATPAPADPLEQAIEEIHRAMLEYAGEMKK